MREIEEIRSAIDIEGIEKAVREYDLVLMLVDGAGWAENLTRKFCHSETLRQAKKRIMLLSEADVAPMDVGNCRFVKISEKERNALEQLYHMYEFSDRFRMLADDGQCGTLLNYAKAGMMTLEEVFQVFLK